MRSRLRSVGVEPGQHVMALRDDFYAAAEGSYDGGLRDVLQSPHS